MEKQQIEKLERESIEKLAKESIEKLEREQAEKFQRYAVEGRRYLMSKYFSDKTIFGGNIFEVKMTKDGETTKMSRFPGYQSYADPANFGDGSSSKSISTGVKKTKDGETTKVSRFPVYQSHADPANSDDDSSSESMSF
ncbi:uncharacterized protein LOC132052347 [Lycium ferocissimum]|uniref:uncharacterized protein LOC132052347 n=1 Tax=Lycium ferocissimum TaxID=112874 RepID=UPI002814FB11|nr:uncharacterized protein LOC132052347 [Lycium ferocissimum]XP_059299826.1 uncharacterized protein LOC132052347 [Lycium ferocissimum]